MHLQHAFDEFLKIYASTASMSRFGVWGLGFGVLGFGFGFWVLGFGFWELDLEFRAWGLGLGLGFGVWVSVLWV